MPKRHCCSEKEQKSLYYVFSAESLCVGVAASNTVYTYRVQYGVMSCIYLTLPYVTDLASIHPSRVVIFSFCQFFFLYFL